MNVAALRIAGVAVLLLAGCATAPRQVAAPDAERVQVAREAQLRPDTRWALVGKIAVSDGRDGGSGRIVWRQDGEHFEIEVRAPVSKHSWRLRGDARGAELDGVEGGPHRAADAETLLREAVGWNVPLAHLAAWVRGTRGDGGAQIEFDAEQRPARLRQAGWDIEYRSWNDARPALPLRVFARSGNHRVRLAVERWDDGSGG